MLEPEITKTLSEMGEEMERFYSRKKRKLTQVLVQWVMIVTMLLIGTGYGTGICYSATGSGGSNTSDQEGVSIAGSGFASWVIKEIGSGIIAYVTGDSMGWLLSFVGGNNTDQAFVDAVGQMNQKLDMVITELGEIEEALAGLIIQINIDTDEIKNIEQQFNIADPQNIINNTYDNMKGVFTADKIGTSAGKTASKDTADDILSTSGSNIDQQMYDVHAGIMGATPGVGDGAMDAFTNVLVDHTGDGQLLNRYKALETYFNRLVTVQTKGLSLVVEALHARDSQQVARGMPPVDYEGTAKQWMDNKFTPWMEDEVEEFLRCTARLVIAECDLRTDAGAVVSFLPGDAEEIFKRADFIAAQIAPARHPFGAVVRLIGEPDTIKSLIADYKVMANRGTPMNVVKLGLDKKDVMEIPVEKWNHWPAGWTRAYMQWNWDSFYDKQHFPNYQVAGFVKFNAATTVAVAKVSLSDAAKDATYVINTTFPHETANGSLKTCECDGDMNCVSSISTGKDKYIYGHTTLVIRHRPHDWVFTYDQGSGGRISMLCDHSNLNDNPPWVRAVATLNNDIHWDRKEEWFHLASVIFFQVVNGMNETRKITAKVQMSSHYYVDLGIEVKENYSFLGAFWDYMDSAIGQYTGWDPKGGNPYDYGESSISYDNLAAGAALRIGVGAYVKGTCKGDKGGEIGLRIWPRHLYLFF